ncbi:MAG: hypothetical protein V2A34_04185 [Lentisphaerota bacterium]
MARTTVALLVGLFAAPLFLGAAEFVIAPAGGDYTSIQAGLNVAGPGDTVTVRAGVYNEKLTLPGSGNPTNGWIHLRAYPGEKVVLDGTNRVGANMIYMENRGYIRISGFGRR